MHLLLLGKGESTWKLSDLKQKLSSIWSLSKPWKLISIGHGYYHVLLNSSEEKNKVWGRRTTALTSGLLRLQYWIPEFNPTDKKSTNAQICVRLYHLPWEYWHPKIFISIAKGIGAPLKLDNATLNRDFGHYTRMLVDVDFRKPLSENLLVE